MKRFANKNCIVTGSTQGIGFAIAKQFLKEGGNVTICSRKQHNLNQAIQILEKENYQKKNFLAVQCHIGIAEDREKLVKLSYETFGKIDVLVNNAATNTQLCKLIETTQKNFERIFDINVASQLFMTQCVFPYLSEKPNILFISSVAAQNPYPPISLYGVTKAAIEAMVKSLADELQNVRVNAIAPGLIKTEFSKVLWQNYKGYVGEAQDIANTAAFVCSDEAKFINGEIIVVSGNPKNLIQTNFQSPYLQEEGQCFIAFDQKQYYKKELLITQYMNYSPTLISYILISFYIRALYSYLYQFIQLFPQ